MSKGTNMNPNLEKCSQSNNAILETELELLLLEQQLQKQRQTRNLYIEKGNDLNMCRSGSAPPTIDGAMSSVGSLFRASNSWQLTNNNVSGSVTNGAMTEEEIRSHPAYLAYYYSSDNKNPRLPPPLLSREDWRIAQRVGSSFGGREDWRNNNIGDCRGSSSLFSNPPAHKADNELMLLRSATNNNILRKKSPNLVDQSMLERAGTDMGLRRKSFANIVQEGSGQHALASHMSRPSSHNSLIDSAVTRSSELQATTSTSEVFPNMYSGDVHGGVSGTNNMNRLSSDTSRVADVADSLAALSMSNNQFRRQDNHHLHSQLRHPQFHSAYANGLVPPNINMSRHDLDGNQSLPRKAYSSADMQSQVDHPDFACLEEWNSYNMGNNNPAAGLEFQRALINAQMKRNAAILDPQHIHQRGNDHVRGDLHDMDMMYLENFLSQQKLQCQPPIYNSSDLHNLHHTYVGLNPYKGKHVGRSLYTDVGTGTSMYQNKRIPIVEKSSSSATTLHSQTETSMGGPASTLLEELKNNTRCLELPDVMGHVTEFSMDQYGSRFIQQKLVTTTTEEKMKIFEEIRPYARSLMTDVFGNYVIQKIFEHGTQDQRKELASQLIGHVLPLSLQMYGCRVIQKALEVVDVEHQTKMVAELDGSVMKCVHDQNGNHVIQKCIEFVPSDKIQFIISSFFGQVVSLSMHPYGCRVIQRVLEHYNDPEAQNLIMDEIMQCICTLAQDQYGNYVIQHVLQRGKAHERSSIISQLAGQIVKMSQQKYASNVVEKCLTFGSPGERQILVKEMLGSTDENAPLQAMMKDPFGNYVVQKILETCDNKSRELILSRIKVHLNTLKRYTYGKHVVSRVEKLLITAGETPTNNQP